MVHALVIGGTGMLANTSLWLVGQGFHVSVIGRNEFRMGSVIHQSSDSSQITPIIVDYCNIPLLQTKLRATIEQNGPIDLVIAWIHSYAGRTLESIVSEVSSCRNRPWKLFHILGSSANLSGIQENLNLPNSALYYQIQLGFIIENGHSRWLTNEEISQGVIDSIRQNRLITIVGTLQPWEKRPSSS